MASAQLVHEPSSHAEPPVTFRDAQVDDLHDIGRQVVEHVAANAPAVDAGEQRAAIGAFIESRVREEAKPCSLRPPQVTYLGKLVAVPLNPDK
jgi:hypothetical protein